MNLRKSNHLALAVLAVALGLASPVAYAGGNLLSAAWGLDDALVAFPDCPESVDQDGMPVVLDAELDNLSLDAWDFEVELESGARRVPICATTLPALEENEDRTVLLIGDLGSQEDPPRWVRVVDELRAEDGSVLGGAVAVPDYAGGPSLILGEMVPVEDTECPADTASAVRLIFSGGVLSADGDEFQAADVEHFAVDTLAGVVEPFGFSDLNDFDNNLELCLDTVAVVRKVTVADNTAIDPNGDPNLVTSTSVAAPDNALEINGLWYDPATDGEGFTVTQGGQGTVAYFFGYDALGERLWLISDVIAAEFLPDQAVSVPLFQGDGGVFEMPMNTVALWGTLTMTVESCNTIRFEMDGVDGLKTLNTVRLADGGRTCEDAPDASETPFEEILLQGVGRYLGVYSPSISEELGGGVMTHSFSSENGGPMCFTGNEFAMSTRDGSRDDLLIFLQGGGLCSPAGCSAVETADPVTMPPIGMLNANDDANPTADFDTAYLPYCDGSLWSGDAEVDTDGNDSTDRSFRGLKNLSASLDVIAATYPTPNRILLAGNSAGGSGVHFALPLVRALYPDVPIELINDSGLAILPSRDQAAGLFQYWGSLPFFPASCSNCIGADGNLTDYYKWQLTEDAYLRMAYIGSKQDATLAAVQPGGGEAFEDQLLSMIDEIKADAPDQFFSLIADDDAHTFILRDFDYPIGGTTVREWITDMLDEVEGWDSLSD